jgi:hypothetical protein
VLWKIKFLTHSHTLSGFFFHVVILWRCEDSCKKRRITSRKRERPVKEFCYLRTVNLTAAVYVLAVDSVTQETNRKARTLSTWGQQTHAAVTRL